ncbi:MAG: NADP-dependent oxidoreductase [Steroidobacteraceae bacterium]|jgi:NADPH-dependent curcumin reductase CurA|nr:NADP-dependent oxidoreductase [Steroidobacteraceae bacterium]
MSDRNFRILFARTPSGLPVPEDFGRDEVAIPTPADGQFLSRTIWLSLDPYYRNVMKNSPIYGDRLAPGDPMVGETVAQVVQSRHAGFAVGDYVAVRNGWQQYAVSNGAGVRKLDATAAPLSTALGVLGMPGLTGYAGLVYLGEPKPGQTVVVSAATGPVGSTVGQVARLMGARSVGIAGSAAKCDYAVRELGYAACVNYRDGDLRAALKEACPEGIDVYFDNVGGDTLAAVFGNLALGARIVLCGMIEAYSMDRPPAGPFLGPVVGARATIKGLVVYDHMHRLPELQRVVGGWIRDGRFRWREDVADGLEQAPEAFCRLMRGQNFGKALVRVAPERA